MKITACIITLNEEKNLPRCLASIAPVVDEMVIVDSGSKDETLSIASRAKARIIHQSWMGYVDQKNFAIEQASYPWVLSIDADEELSQELIESIQSLKAEEGNDATRPVGYAVSRLVCYRGKWIYHGDWYPDRLVRLFKKEFAKFEGGRVHERLVVKELCGSLKGDLHHYTYTDPQDRANRIKKYAELWAESAWERGKTASVIDPPLHAFVRLLRGYVLKGGFLDGGIGWEIALGNAREVWLKYSRLREFRRQGRTNKFPESE